LVSSEWSEEVVVVPVEPIVPDEEGETKPELPFEEFN